MVPTGRRPQFKIPNCDKLLATLSFTKLSINIKRLIDWDAKKIPPDSCIPTSIFWKRIAPKSSTPPKCKENTMTHTKSREIHLKNRPEGMPQEADFELAVVELPDIGEG